MVRIILLRETLLVDMRRHGKTCTWNVARISPEFHRSSARIHPVRIARIHVTRFSPRVGLPRDLFVDR